MKPTPEEETQNLELPWTVRELPDEHFLRTNHKYAIDGRVMVMAKVEGMGTIPKARAEYIVRAVTAFPALVAALQGIMEADKRGELHRDPLDTNHLFAAAKKALKSAQPEAKQK